MAKRKQQTKKQKKTVTEGIVHILSTFNNTIVTITLPFLLITLHLAHMGFTEGLTFMLTSL